MFDDSYPAVHCVFIKTYLLKYKPRSFNRRFLILLILGVYFLLSLKIVSGGHEDFWFFFLIQLPLSGPWLSIFCLY